jgi:hypothetical protein
VAAKGGGGTDRPKTFGTDNVIYNYLVQMEEGRAVPVPRDYALYIYRRNTGLKWHELTGDSWQHPWRTELDLHYGSVEAEYEDQRPRE